MKTRIISGIVMAAVVALVLVLGLCWQFYVIIGFGAIIAAIASYELLHNVAGIENKIALAGAAIYTAVSATVIILDGINVSNKIIEPKNIACIYFLFAAIVMIFYHNEFSLEKIVIFSAMPLFISFGFAKICGITSLSKGIYYLLLMLDFSSVCDMGAYFIGSKWGKRKLCPAVSPKKTVEGAIGGIVSSVVFAVILMFCFRNTNKFLMTLILTVPFCMIGMIGDLFTSLIKRSVGIKDYGNLIPGHGGILDRFDSMLFIAPFLYMYATAGVL